MNFSYSLLSPSLVCLITKRMNTDEPLLTESIYLPLLLSVQLCLLFEVISLWLEQWIAALSFRSMIILIIVLILYLKSRTNEKYTAEFPHLLRVILIQDLIVMLLTQGLFVLYTWVFIYLPASFILIRPYVPKLLEKLKQTVPESVV